MERVSLYHTGCLVLQVQAILEMQGRSSGGDGAEAIVVDGDRRFLDNIDDFPDPLDDDDDAPHPAGVALAAAAALAAEAQAAGGGRG